MKVLVAQSCPTLCKSLPGSSVRGILQARMLEWVAIPFSRGDTAGLLNCGQILYRVTWEVRTYCVQCPVHALSLPRML